MERNGNKRVDAAPIEGKAMREQLGERASQCPASVILKPPDRYGEGALQGPGCGIGGDRPDRVCLTQVRAARRAEPDAIDTASGAAPGKQEIKPRCLSPSGRQSCYPSAKSEYGVSSKDRTRGQPGHATSHVSKVPGRVDSWSPCDVLWIYHAPLWFGEAVAGWTVQRPATAETSGRRTPRASFGNRVGLSPGWIPRVAGRFLKPDQRAGTVFRPPGTPIAMLRIFIIILALLLLSCALAGPVLAASGAARTVETDVLSRTGRGGLTETRADPSPGHRCRYQSGSSRRDLHRWSAAEAALSGGSGGWSWAGSRVWDSRSPSGDTLHVVFGYQIPPGPDDEARVPRGVLRVDRWNQGACWVRGSGTLSGEIDSTGASRYRWEASYRIRKDPI